MQRFPFLYFAASDIAGRGIYTAEPIEKDTLIEICPMLVLPEKDFDAIHGSALHDYYFLWGEETNQCAIALGFGSLYNHSYEPNARYLIDYDEETIEIYTRRLINAGEEITVNYNGDPKEQTPVWFDNPDGSTLPTKK